MNVDEYTRRLEALIISACGSALRDTLKETDRRMTELIPGNRTKTRRAIKTKVRRTSQGYRGTIGLRFSRKYRIRGTETHRLFKSAWRRVRGQVPNRFRHHLFAKLKRT